jgi:hypothetical protein
LKQKTGSFSDKAAFQPFSSPYRSKIRTGFSIDTG